MPRIYTILRIIRLLTPLAILCGMFGFARGAESARVASHGAEATTASAFQTIWTFSGLENIGFPATGVALDASGNVYGTASETTNGCSTSNCGVAYSLTKPAPGTTAWTLKYIHVFSTLDGPVHGPLVAVGSTLYGTTDVNDGGVIFSLTTGGAYKVLHRFAASGAEGSFATTGMLVSNGTLYGTTMSGGTYGAGVFFKINPGGAGYTVLHNFGNGTDGFGPNGGLIVGKDGAIYGTTGAGGAAQLGTVYRITPAGAYSVIHSFILQQGCIPQQRLALGPDGSLYGTTSYGGTNQSYPNGSAWSLTPVTGKPWTFKVLYMFTTSLSGANGIARDDAGNLYGTAAGGGQFAHGVLYRLSPPKSGAIWTYTLLHAFDQQDGEYPIADTLLSAGVLYGPASAGGKVTGSCAAVGGGPAGCGTVFTYQAF